MNGTTVKSEGEKQNKKRAEQNWLTFLIIISAVIAFDGYKLIGNGKTRVSVYTTIFER